MPESQNEYWARRADEHARLAQMTSHQAAYAAHDTLARAYRRRAEERRTGG
ncbi:hypothetical protein [Sphingomonas sp.]|jgi:hypothetical protein|uniref:hypothetical protein n=1 Tax=Sphingomonas sp. TaxID=28214 RepID=UPI002DE461FE|nr:hypothetical protein [Sphingomonas sp.]